MNSLQERVVKLCESASPKKELTEWTRGYIPKHYKRLNISMEEAIRLAKMGVVEAMTCFNTNIYFTQALMFGAVIEHFTTGKYNTLTIVTTSQYGKSYTGMDLELFHPI